MHGDAKRQNDLARTNDPESSPSIASAGALAPAAQTLQPKVDISPLDSH